MSSPVIGGTWRRWIVTLGGSGMSPVAPGTMGSAAATGVLALVLAGFHAAGVWPRPMIWNSILGVGVLIYSVLCVWLGRWATEYYARKDPGACVLDEGPQKLRGHELNRIADFEQLKNPRRNRRRGTNDPSTARYRYRRRRFPVQPARNRMTPCPTPRTKSLHPPLRQASSDDC